MAKSRILIVEDESLVALDIKRIVNRCGYEPAGIFSSGAAALKHVEEKPCDLVLMDIRLKGPMDGIEAASQLRSRFDIPVILLTAYSDQATVSRIREVDPYGYLTKPVKEAELQTTIEIALFRHEYSRRLAESEKRYRMLFEEAPTANLVTDSSWEVLDSNHLFQSLFQYQAQEASLEFSSLFADHNQFVDFQNAITGAGERWEGELDLVTAAGKELRVLAGVNIAREEGRLKEVRLYLVDVTNRHQLEIQLLQSQKMESIGRLAGGVAHDFNNILTVIKGYLFQADLNLKSDKGITAELEGVKSAADKAKDLTRQLLAFSRKQDLKPSVENLNDRVQNMEKMLRRLVSEDVSISLYLGSERPSVFIDPSQFEMVLMNLTLNASDAIEKGRGRISIATDDVVLSQPLFSPMGSIPAGEYLVIRVEDNGSGMPAELINKIFEPFFTTKEEGKGTGLGLSTVLGIVKQSAGYILVDSTEGKGSCFSVYFAHSNSVAVDTRGIEEGEQVNSDGSETVLVVEDDPSLRKLAGIILRSSGYQLLEASNPGEALLIAEENRGIDLILTDLIMPHMNGAELVQRMRSQLPTIKAIYMSGYPEAMREDMELDPDPIFLLKPFEAEALLSAVRSSLDCST